MLQFGILVISMICKRLW